jgi:hypothetical protein
MTGDIRIYFDTSPDCSCCDWMKVPAKHNCSYCKEYCCDDCFIDDEEGNNYCIRCETENHWGEHPETESESESESESENDIYIK